MQACSTHGNPQRSGTQHQIAKPKPQQERVRGLYHVQMKQAEQQRRYQQREPVAKTAQRLHEDPTERNLLKNRWKHRKQDKIQRQPRQRHRCGDITGYRLIAGNPANSKDKIEVKIEPITERAKLAGILSSIVPKSTGRNGTATLHGIFKKSR